MPFFPRLRNLIDLCCEHFLLPFVAYILHGLKEAGLTEQELIIGQLRMTTELELADNFFSSDTVISNIN